MKLNFITRVSILKHLKKETLTSFIVTFSRNPITFNKPFIIFSLPPLPNNISPASK